MKSIAPSPSPLENAAGLMVPLSVPSLELLDPERLSPAAEESARELMRQGQSENTRASYLAAMRYWAAWYGGRFGIPLALPVPVAAVVLFLVDHAEREIPHGRRDRHPHSAEQDFAASAAAANGRGSESPEAGTPPGVVRPEPAARPARSTKTTRRRTKLVHDLPDELDEALVARGFKGKLGPLSLNTLVHRLAVLSKAHQNINVDNPCNHRQVRELIKNVRSAYAKRGVRPHKQAALTSEPLEAMLATCDDSPRGKRDRALLLFAWSSGGRRRSEVSDATMEDLRQVGSRGFLFTLGHSKTNQDGRSDADKPVTGVAAEALEAWLEVSGITEGPIFRRVLKSGKVLEEGLAPKAVRKIVQERCLKAGLPAEFSAHSLRSGFVTEAGRQKVSPADAMAMTGHRNYETFMGYYQAEDPLDSPAGQLMGGRRKSSE